MTGAILRFSLRRTAAVLVCRERDGAGWLVCARDHGWMHGDRRSALTDAHWLAWNLGLPIRELIA
jgi:hypothetical protein